LCLLSLVLVVIPVVWVLSGVIAKAVAVWHWSVLTEPTTGVGGGLSNTIVGTLVLMVSVAIVAGVVGIGCGIYFAEMRPRGHVTSVLRTASEVLAGIPSIVFGYVAFIALVEGLHWGYSLLAGVIALSALVVPYIAKSTELALNQVPLTYREGGEALGMTRTHVLRRVVVRSAIPGISTGLILALAISVGETAPLLFTVGFSNGYPSGALLHQSSEVGYLPYAVYSFFESPFANVRALASDASLILIVLVLLLILATRLIVRLTQKYAPNRAIGTGGGRQRRQHERATG
jgi:phosphate transport system permease protein